MKKSTAILAAVAALFALAACTEAGPPKSNATEQEQTQTETALSQFLKAQPIPQFTWSQLRQNLIELQTAQASTTATTSFFFNQGVVDPVMQCPSIGFAIPATYQLTNPDKDIWSRAGSDGISTAVIAQMESTGVYTADTSGTYVICIDDSGDGYAFYWEGFVSTVTGPATWDPDTKRIALTGAPSAEFSTEQD